MQCVPAENIKQEMCKTLYAGSWYETTSIDGLSSDIDLLVTQTDYRVINNIKQWIPGDKRHTYMIDEEDSYRSYVKLYRVSCCYPGPVYKEMADGNTKPVHVVDNDLLCK